MIKMLNTYLYVKTHNKTGLKYLGKTVRNPYSYKGSGTRWINHIKKHGNDVKTQILFETNDKEKLKEIGLYYSELWNIVESNEWANIKPENGDGGGAKGKRGKQKNPMKTRPPLTEEHKEKIRNTLKNKSPEECPSRVKKGMVLFPYGPGHPLYKLNNINNNKKPI